MVIWLWVAFVAFILAMLTLDLGVLNRRARIVGLRQALLWSGFCAILALAFTVVVYFLYEHEWLGVGVAGGKRLPGREAALQFLAGWLIEQSLSLDNIFVIAMIFAYFQVPREYQHRTLFWGIMGALVMRGVMILAGTAVVQQFQWVLYVFGALLIITGVKMLLVSDRGVAPERNPLVRLARRLYPVSSGFVGERFFTRIGGRRAITPLFLVLLVIESTDVLFAIDSIPAVFAITVPWNDPFIIFTSNIFAILNLRSLYFALAELLERFRHLKYSLVAILIYVGVKMLIVDFAHIPTGVSLGVIVVMLTTGIITSTIASRRVPTATSASHRR
jgi:tellurite resistance protein TerC